MMTTASTAGDADGDLISDADEGGATGTDTDGDGTPDFQDDDSDGDGIPDYREAGDADAATAPVDTDGDGTPDFRDTDSDDNGRDDGVDGVDDIDGDGVLELRKTSMTTATTSRMSSELGANAAQPIDTDGDGIARLPRHRQRQRHDDRPRSRPPTTTTPTAPATSAMSTADDDCVPDQRRGARQHRRRTPMRPPDFIDRDSDNDGIADGAEDANCNGVRDPGEIEPDERRHRRRRRARSDRGRPPAPTRRIRTSNPQANGDFVFVEPYMKPQTPTDDDLDFSTKLQAVDLYVLLDRSGSMSTEIVDVKNNLATVVQQPRRARRSAPAQPANCIPDLWAGAGTIGYQGSGAARIPELGPTSSRTRTSRACRPPNRRAAELASR